MGGRSTRHSAAPRLARLMRPGRVDNILFSSSETTARGRSREDELRRLEQTHPTTTCEARALPSTGSREAPRTFAYALQITRVLERMCVVVTQTVFCSKCGEFVFWRRESARCRRRPEIGGAKSCPNDGTSDSIRRSTLPEERSNMQAQLASFDTRCRGRPRQIIQESWAALLGLANQNNERTDVHAANRSCDMERWDPQLSKVVDQVDTHLKFEWSHPVGGEGPRVPLQMGHSRAGIILFWTERALHNFDILLLVTRRLSRQVEGLDKARVQLTNRSHKIRKTG